MPSLELTIDIILVLLLAGVIVSAWILNSRLNVVRKGQAEMADLVQQLNIATSNAQKSVAELKNAGITTQELLSIEVKKARALADELTLITEAGDSLANRIEKNLTGASSGKKSNKKTIQEADPAEILDDIHEKATKKSKIKSDDDLLEALKQAR